MAAFEGSSKSQLQGVSQQVARERLDGQVSAQENMLSDVVTGIRRRPGAEYQYHELIPGSTAASILGWDSDMGGQRVHFVLDINTGVVHIYNLTWTKLAALPANPYLVASRRKAIRTTTIGDRFAICNVDKKPALGAAITGQQNPAKTGFFFIRTGAFEKAYDVAIQNVVGFTYTTPAASVSGAAAQSSPEYICQALANGLSAAGAGLGMSAVAFGSFCFIVYPGATQPVNIETGMQSSYLQTSTTSYVPQASDLPQRLHVFANGMICATGSLREPTYFQYDSGRTAWIECGKYGSPGSITNMPVQIEYTTGGVWQYAPTPYEGRLAGDDTSNPAPNFITRGITGMGSYQGRLVLLSGSLVNLSASAKPLRFWRSTVTSLLSSDPIEVGSSANSSAAYEYCVPFARDLLLFSEKYQALIPGGSVALTPSTATVVVTSTYDADMNAQPLPLGRTLMFPAPRSLDFYGMMEMLPSQYTDSQYLSSDVTAHLPKYLPGRCRFGVSSSVANLAVFASDRDLRSLIVHEYTWEDTKKVQSAWHRWTFPYDIADAFFTGSEINLLFTANGTLMVGTVDPRIGTLTAQSDRRPYLDLYTSRTAVANRVDIPAGFTLFDPLMYQKVKLSDTDADLMGEEVGITDDGRFSDHVVTVPSFPDGPCTMGIPYRSTLSPTPPNVKDANGVVISSNKLSILRYMVGTTLSSEYSAIVRDASVEEGEAEEQTMPALYWGSAELDLGKARINNESIAILPCRTAAATTTLMLFTEGLGEMNFLSLEYTCRYNQRLRRR